MRTSFPVHQVGDVYGVDGVGVDRNEEATDSESHDADHDQDHSRILHIVPIGSSALDDSVDYQHSEESDPETHQQDENLYWELSTACTMDTIEEVAKLESLKAKA